MTFSYDGALKLPGSRVIWGEVTRIDAGSRRLIYVDRASEVEKEIVFSALVCATGLSHIIPGQLPDKSLSGQQMHEHLRSLQQEIAAAPLPIAVIGGGPVGCEFAGEVKCEHPEKPVVLLHSRKRLVSSPLSGLSDEFARVLKSKLSQLGVEVMLDTGRKYSLEDFGAAGGKSYTATGLKQTESGYKLYPAAWLSNGELVVNKYLQVKVLAEKGIHNVYACGDVAYTDGDYKKAGVGFRQAKVIAENIEKELGTGRSEEKDFSIYKSTKLKLPKWKKALVYLIGFVRCLVEEDGALGMAVGRTDGLSQYSNILWSDRAYRSLASKDKGAGKMKSFLYR